MVSHGNNALGLAIKNEGSTDTPDLTSPISSPTSAKTVGGKSRKRTQHHVGLESSPGSGEDVREAHEDRSRPSGLKRACNECRQQKVTWGARLPLATSSRQPFSTDKWQLRCNVVQAPTYIPCERCRRLNIQCRIEQNFKRVGKRSKNAEMEREIIELRNRIASQHSSPIAPSNPRMISTSASPSISQLSSTLDQYMGSQEAVSTLLDLRSGLEGGSFMRSPNGQILPSRRLEDVLLTHDRVRDLFQQYVVISSLSNEVKFDLVGQFLRLVSSFPAIARSWEIIRRLLRCIFPPLLDHCRSCCSSI
jgi:hypothetical protein